MQVTDATFDAEVLQSSKPVLVDFWASWCPPCKMMEPVVERVRDEIGDRAVVVDVNIDRNPKAAASYNVDAVPCFIVFVGGEPVGRRTGALTARQLRLLIEKACEQPA